MQKLEVMRWSLLAVFIFLAITIGFTQNKKGKDYALFFANADYSTNTDFDNLKNPVKDVQAIAKELKEMYSFETKVYENYTRTQIYRVLEQWQQRRFGSDDQFFLFFSGHGTFWEFTKKGYFIPKTNNTDYSAYVELTDLGNIVTQIPCRHILLAVDACYSGTIDQEIAFKGRGFSRPRENATSDRNNLIAQQLRNQSRLLLTSGGKQRTPDGRDHSPFSKAILDGLRAAYTYGDGLFTFTDLVGKLERVSPTPHQGELPQHEQGGFVFVAEGSAGLGTNKATIPNRPPDDMVLVRGGSFQMGSNEGDSDEKPVHSVTLSDFYMSRFEVTVEDFGRFVQATNYKTDAETGDGSNFWENDKWVKKPGINWRHDAKGKIRPANEYKHPVIHVSWNDAVAYCNWLSEQHQYQPVYMINGDQVTANWNASGYRLPTEAEWEFAARSRGKDYKYAWGNGAPNGNIADESAKKVFTSWTIWDNYSDGHIYTAPVGQFQQGDLGLFDMTGNVWEWCWDWYNNTYPSTAQTNPKGQDTGSNRVFRGGSWDNEPAGLRCANRLGYYSPDFRDNGIGFRLSRAGR